MNAVLNYIASNGSKATFKFVKAIEGNFEIGDVATLKVQAPANGFAMVVFPNGKMFALGTLLQRGFATIVR